MADVTTPATTTPTDKKDDENKIDRCKIIIGASVAVLAAAIAIPLVIKLCSSDDDEDEAPITIGSTKLAFVSAHVHTDVAVNYANTQSL
ncbi:unnamed protein product [Agarophyton chilense]